MRFTDILSAVKALTNVTNQDNEIKRCVRAGLEYVASLHDWPHYRDWHFITTVDDYTTGTVAVTNNSTTVTGTSTVWTSAMVGRKFRVGSEKAYYTIASVASSTSLTLDQAYQGTTASGSSYTIFQDEYRLRGDVDKPKMMRQIQNGVALFDLNYGEFDESFPAPSSLGEPVYGVPLGRPPTTYATGTVATTVNSATITGTSTSWTTVQGLSRGNRIAVRSTSEVFTILSVDSNTQITAYENAASANSSSNYTAFLDNFVIQVYPIPNAVRNLYYRYGRIPKPPVNDWDELDMPRSWHYMMVWWAAIWAFTFKGNMAQAEKTQTQFDTMLSAELRAIGTQQVDRVYLKKSMDSVINTIGPTIRNLPSGYGIPLNV